MEKLVSVIVPCYNMEKELPRCLNSLINQTYPAIEIIVVNDGSTDDSQKVADRFASEYSNITVVNKVQSGLPQARKTGVRHATGEYIGFVDSDDWVEPDMYEKLCKALVNSNADIASGGLFFDYGNKSIPQKSCFATDTVISQEEAICHLHQRDEIFPYLCQKLYKKILFDEVVFPQRNFVGEDYSTNVQVLKNVTRIAVVTKPLYHYVQHSVSMSRNKFSENSRFAYQNYKKICDEMCRQYPICEEQIGNYMAVEYLAMIVAMARGKQYDKVIAKEILRFIRMHLKSILLAPYIEKKYKLAALACSLHYKVLGFLYHSMIDSRHNLE